MPKESLKDKLEGNELDLSMSELQTIPVKEIVSKCLYYRPLMLCLVGKF